MEAVDAAGLVLRGIVALVMGLHGWNHLFGGGKLAGTERWFSSIGFRHARVHALLASVGELGSAALLALGLLTPFAAGAVIGTMLVALIANHLRNGFFIFRPGEGYEYVLTLAVVAFAIAVLGPGGASVDDLAGIVVDGWAGAAVAAVVGVGGAALTLLTSWRPVRQGAGAG